MRGHGSVATRSLVIALLVAGCIRGAAFEGVDAAPAVPTGLDLHVPSPADDSAGGARIALGRRLFFDAILSADRSVSCASCHDPTRAFTDGQSRATGVHGRRTSRSTPSLLNAAYARHFSWDGREDRLEAQVVAPISNPDEMDLPLAEAVARLGRVRAYRAAFQRAFNDSVTANTLARALAAYVRSLLSADAPVDRFVAGDTTALTPAARRGYALFVGRAGCSGCHLGPLFSDEKFHNTGVGWGGADQGRYLATRRDADRGAFNTPSLRNVARTAPYMHDGSIPDLAGVIAFYERGGVANPNRDRELRAIRLDVHDREDLIAFLASLSGRIGTH